MTISGDIEAIGVSGRHWIGDSEQSAYELLKKILESANRSIRISAYSLGKKSPELDRIFSILKNKTATGVSVQVILNKFWETDDYAKKKLQEMEHSNFHLVNYDPEDKTEDLHAKIIVVDSQNILIGSANLSKSGLFSNHEIVVQINGGAFATRINKLLDVFVASIRGEQKR
jgi:phosphatidylserine/phosphatidylglycerophosphate/cardiolipin synthase-like enzyme